MINAERILVSLDHHLDHEVELIIYGRAAIALGFDGAPESVKHSFDVDALIPVSRVSAFREDEAFWSAQETANTELEGEGLYITQLLQGLSDPRGCLLPDAFHGHQGVQAGGHDRLYVAKPFE